MLAVAAVLALAVPASATNYWWAAGTGEFHEPTNWTVQAGTETTPTNGYPSTVDDRAYIANGGTAEVIQADGFKTCTVGFYGTGEMEGSGNITMDTDVTFSPKWLICGNFVPRIAPASVVTQTTGTLNVTGYYKLGFGDTAETGNGMYVISGGSLQVASYMQVGSLSDIGQGVFKVDNSAGNVGSLSMSTYFGLTTDSLLEIVLSSAGTTSVIQVGTDATLRGTLTIDDSNYAPTIGDKVTVLTAGGTLDTTGLVSGNPAWQINTYTGGSGTLEVEYTPEPATMVLLSLGGIGVLFRRRGK